MRRFLIAILMMAAAVTVSRAALAADAAPYTTERFLAAQAAGGPIIVEIHASWCPVCAKQKPVLSGLRDTEFKDLAAFAIDFDTQKELVKLFGANAQSTLIVYRGSIEKGRSVGVSDPAALKALVQKAYAP